MEYNIILGPVEYETKDLRRLLRKHITHHNLNKLDQSNLLFLNKLHPNAGKVDPDAIVKSLKESIRTIKNGSDLTIAIIGTPFQGKHRVIIYPNKNIALISTYALDKTPYFLSDCVALVYTAIVRMENDFSEEHEIERCGLFPITYQNYIHTELCRACKEKLPYSGANVVRKMHGISSDQNKNGQIVLVQHGIRTRGYWSESTKTCLDNYGFIVKVFRYHYFSTFRLLFNPIFGTSIRDKFYRMYKNVRELNPDAEVSVIAHSYGTLLISTLLEERKDIYLDKLIFVNGIVPRDYNWASLITSGQVRRVLNECGDKDIIPILADIFVPKADSSGVFFFDENSDDIVNQRYPNCGHSTLLKKPSHCESVWAEYLLDDEWVNEGKIVKVTKLPEFLDQNKKLVFFLTLALLAIIVVSLMSL